MKTLNSLLALSMIVLFASGCAPFRASNFQSNEGSVETREDNEQNNPPSHSTPIPPANPPGQPPVQPPGQPPVVLPKSKSQELAFDISYAQLHGVTQDRLNEALNKFIRRSNCNSVGANEYRCGELPFGEIVDANKKKILTLPMPEMTGSEGDLSYFIAATNVPIYLARKQSGSVIDVQDITLKKSVVHFAGQGVAEDVFLKLNPQGGKIQISMCMALPGLKVFAEKTRMTGHIIKDMPLIIPDLKSDLLIDVNPGWVELKAAKLCSDLLVEIDAQNLPVISLQKVHVPKEICADHMGLVVDVNAQLSGLWGFVNNILKVFRIDLEKIIAKEVKKEVLKLSQQHMDVNTQAIEDGKWMADFLATGHLERTVTDLSQKLRNEMIHQGWLDLASEQALQVSCISALQHTGLSAVLGNAAFKTCALAPQLQFKFLEDNAPQRQMGCYSHYFSVTGAIPANAWWANACSLKNRIILKADAKVASLYECLAESWNMNLAPDTICQNEIADFIDALEVGDLDYLFNNPNLQVTPPTVAQLERLREIAGEQFGIQIPPIATLKNLFN